MPVMPSFTGFAPTPDLAGAYLGGVAASQRDTQIANQSQQASQQIAMEQQKLQASLAQSQMEMQVKQQQLQQNSMLEDQKLRIQQQYETAQIGLKNQQLDQAAQKIQIQTKQAADKFAAQQAFQKARATYQTPEGGGLDEASASDRAIKEFAPSMGVNGAALGNIYRKPAASLPPAMLESVGNDPTGRFKTIQTSATGRQVFDTQGSDLSRKRFEAGQDNTRLNALRRDRERLQKLQADPTIALIVAKVKSNPNEAGSTSKQVYEDYKARAAQISELEKQLPEYQPKSRFKEGQEIVSNKDGKTYVVVNGRPVLKDQAQEGGDQEETYNPDEAQ